MPLQPPCLRWTFETYCIATGRPGLRMLALLRNAHKCPVLPEAIMVPLAERACLHAQVIVRELCQRFNALVAPCCVTDGLHSSLLHLQAVMIKVICNPMDTAP